MDIIRVVAAMGLIAITECDAFPPAEENVSGQYRPPEAFGLIGVRPYPTDRDVCQVIGETEATAGYLDDAALLIGCPELETGAIDDRLAEGAVRLDQVGTWVLLSVPLR